ncbi:Fc.00g036500.m01.CDS01 [Cosmosporella sp. VM-42]
MPQGLLSVGATQKDFQTMRLFSSCSRILVGQEKCPSKLSGALEQGIDLIWEGAYDFVHPFGDSRGGLFNSVWTFDLDKYVLFLTKKDRFCSAPLELARERLLALDGFELLNSPKQIFSEEVTLTGPYWEPDLAPLPRARSFLGQILRDFAYIWRHVLRRQMKTTTFMKLAYATIWISTMEFTILERMGFEHISDGGPYVQLIDLPSWETPKAVLVQVGSSWFALAQDTLEGFRMVRSHMNSHLSLGDSATNLVTYAILTLRQVILCKAHGGELVWTRSETLFDGISVSDTAIDMILWATNTSSIEPQPSAINSLPIEIQDRILYHATTSLIASAKLGCGLGLGPPFSWVDRGIKISVQEVKRHRFESSPVESQVIFNGVMSGLPYKRERGYQPIHAGQTPVPTIGLM